MLKIVKKTEADVKQKVFIHIAGIVAALLAAALFLAVAGFNPLQVYISMVNGAFGSSYRISQTVINAVPLIILSLGIAIAFRMKFWNIGAEGQILMGGFLGSYFAYNFTQLPKPLLLFLMLLAGLVASMVKGTLSCQ